MVREDIAGAGPGGGPRVKVFDSAGQPFTSGALSNFMNNFLAYTPGFTGGVRVAVAHIDGEDATRSSRPPISL